MDGGTLGSVVTVGDRTRTGTEDSSSGVLRGGGEGATGQVKTEVESLSGTEVVGAVVRVGDTLSVVDLSPYGVGDLERDEDSP